MERVASRFRRPSCEEGLIRITKKFQYRLSSCCGLRRVRCTWLAGVCPL